MKKTKKEVVGKKTEDIMKDLIKKAKVNGNVFIMICTSQDALIKGNEGVKMTGMFYAHKMNMAHVAETFIGEAPEGCVQHAMLKTSIMGLGALLKKSKKK